MHSWAAIIIFRASFGDLKSWELHCSITECSQAFCKFSQFSFKSWVLNLMTSSVKHVPWKKLLLQLLCSTHPVGVIVFLHRSWRLTFVCVTGQISHGHSVVGRKTTKPAIVLEFVVGFSWNQFTAAPTSWKGWNTERGNILSDSVFGSEAACASSLCGWTLVPDRLLSRVGQPIPLPSGGPSGCQGALLTQIQLAANQPMILFAELLSRPFSPSLYIHPGVPHLSYRIFMWMVTALEFVRILVQGLSTLKGVNTPNLASSTYLLNITLEFCCPISCSKPGQQWDETRLLRT